MKKMIRMLVLYGTLLGGCVQPKAMYVINGTVEEGNPNLYLTAVNESGKLDTIGQVKAEKGTFRLEGQLRGPQLAWLVMEGAKGRIPLYLQDTVFTVDIRKKDLTDVRNYTATGGTLQNRKRMLDQEEMKIYKERDSVLARFYKAEKEQDIFAKMHEMAGLQVMDEMYDQTENEYIAANRDNILGLGLIYYRYRFLNFERLKQKFDMLSEEMKATPEGRLIAARYETLGEVKVGGTAPNFKLPTIDGDNVHLYGKSARVKIVDFWASWCGPCRKENPHLVEIYEKYKDKDLLMISVSLDTDEKAWKDAVKADGMKWIQACDLKGSEGEAARAYRITGIPHIFVLDGNNRIVAEKVKGKELDEVLEKYLQ